MAATGDSQRARRIPDAEWELWRQELVRLYVEEDVTRREIIRIMANEHEFVITDTQLKHRFQKWDVKKYINDEDMTTMLALKRKRQLLGKEIRFQYKGHDVEQERLELIQPYIKVYISPNQSPQPASQAFVRGYSASQDPAQQFNSHFNSQNMQAPAFMDWTYDGPEPSQGVYTRNTNQPGFVEIAQTSQDELMTDAALTSVDSYFGQETFESGFNPTEYEHPRTDATSGLYLTQAPNDVVMSPPNPSGSTFSSGVWASWMNLSSTPAPSELPIDERSSTRLSLPRDMIPSPTTDVMPILGDVENQGGSLSTQVHVRLGNGQPITCENFDPSSALLPLLLMKAQLGHNSYSDPYWKVDSRGSKLDELHGMIHSEWLRLELDNVICWISETVSKNIRQHQTQRRIGKSTSRIEKGREPSAQRRRSDDKIETNGEVPIIGSSYARSESHNGILLVTRGKFLNRETPANALEALTVSYIPKEYRRTIGLCATFVNVMSEFSVPRISPRLRTFNVVPDNSEIISCIKRNDLNGLQLLFDKREASPTDVDSRGFSLLSYAMGHGNCEILRLLLEGGADVQTCNSFSHPMDMVWATWHAFSEAWTAMVLPEHFRNIDQCIRMSDAALRYGCDIDNSVVFNRRLPSPLFFLFYYDSVIPSQDLETAFRYLCNVGYDMEGRDFVGATLFLAQAKTLFPSVISKLRLLIEKGANLRAVDSENRGALHFAFEAPDGWGAWDSSCTGDCAHPDVDHVQWAQEIWKTESKNYAGDYCDHGLTPAPSVVDEDDLEVVEADDEGEDIGGNDPGDEGDVDNDDEDDGEDEDYEDDGEDEDYEYREEDNNNGTEALRIPQGYVLYYNDRGDAVIVREPLPILKTRLRFKLLTLLIAGCDPNLLAKYGDSPSDDARYHGLWPEWTWALLNAGYVLDKDSDRWVKRVEDEIAPVP